MQVRLFSLFGLWTFFSDSLTTQTHTICRGAVRFATKILPLLNFYSKYSSLHWLDLHSNFSFSYNRVYWVHLLLSTCDIIVSQKPYNGEGETTNFTPSLLSLHKKITFWANTKLGHFLYTVLKLSGFLTAIKRRYYGSKMWVWVTKEHCVWVYKRIVWAVKMWGGWGRDGVRI